MKTFHPVTSSRGDQTTTSQFSHFNQTPLDINNQVVNQQPPTSNNEGQYAHEMSQYIPDTINQISTQQGMGYKILKNYFSTCFAEFFFKFSFR